MNQETVEPLGDGELCARVSQGDPVAVTSLHQRFGARIYFIALRELRSSSDAEDIRNEALTRTIEAIRAGRVLTPAALASFVLSTARNVIHEFRRQNRRAEPLEERDFMAPAAALPPDPAIRKGIEVVLRRLKPREQAFLRLYYYDELPKEEISQRLGIPQERVRLIKSRALKSFREIYERVMK